VVENTILNCIIQYSLIWFLLPESLEILHLAGKFNYPVNNLPREIKELRILGWKFNHSIESLPDFLEILQLHCTYKLPINKLPKKILIK
jgi:hypothetical protein